ncbi:MAG: PepSY domain-containing protein, partial [Hyphomonadaceae bacterium]
PHQPAWTGPHRGHDRGANDERGRDRNPWRGDERDRRGDGRNDNRGWTPNDGGYERPAPARVLPIRALIGMVQSQRGGEFRTVLGGLQNDGGRPYYIFRWRYSNGEEDNLRVDASSGQVY